MAMHFITYSADPHTWPMPGTRVVMPMRR